MRTQSLLPRLAALLAAGAAPFLAAELAVRAFHPMDALVYQDSADPLLGSELRPGASGIKNGVEVSISAQGLRDEPAASPRPAGERRVVVIGGHETFGIGVPVEKTYVRELAEGLIDPGQGRARTISLSMYSYRLAQKVELACRRLQGLEPELAVLQVTEGDGLSVKRPLFPWPRFKNWIRTRSALIRWASERYYLRETNAVPHDDYENDVREMRRFMACADAAGARPVIMLVPDIFRLPPGAPSVFRRAVEDAARETGTPLFDAAPALAAVPPEDRLVFPAKPFLAPPAQRALADALRRRLKPFMRRPAKAAPRGTSA